MSTSALWDAEASWTVEALAGLTGFTVRTIRYYATLGLLPPPERRGRVAYYDDRHRARLSLIRTLQDQGLGLASIEEHLSHLAPDSTSSQVELRRAVAQGWAISFSTAVVDRAGLDERAGRKIDDHDLAMLLRLGSLREVDGGYEVGATLDVGLQLLELDIPLESMEAASAAMRNHMDALVLELRDVLRTQVLAKVRAHETDPDQFARTMIRLRQLTLDALVANFQRATDGLMDGSLLGRTGEDEA
ncbi:transcriptional regulator [Nocardioides phosphati]|uniref:Transcriptional regulator n=1 Tax=Nocardioides phosphati TaxID=1867775 RepID=A0ABQ2NDK4_9ACTN|nr:MerR family transcriptional regulator [Nocardioides phosphati]GGO93934.1 transcriptional regulator [Nocardioides phosphati]